MRIVESLPGSIAMSANAFSSIALASGVCLLLLAALGAHPAAGATVYKCPSPEGGVTYSNTPCPGGERMDISLPPPAAGEEAQSPESRAQTAPDTAPRFSGYSAIAILSPGSEDVARDASGAGSVPVALAIT